MINRMLMVFTGLVIALQVGIGVIAYRMSKARDEGPPKIYNAPPIERNLASYARPGLDLVKNLCKTNKYFLPKEHYIFFTKLDFPVIGQCDLYSDASKWTISIDKKFWDEATEDQRHILMLHELAHCLLYAEHVSNDKNYMSPSIPHITKVDSYSQFITDIERFCK